MCVCVCVCACVLKSNFQLTSMVLFFALSDDVLLCVLEFCGVWYAGRAGQTSRVLRSLVDVMEADDGFGRVVPRVWISGLEQQVWHWNPGDPMPVLDYSDEENH